jgi:hypothetical protein
LYIAFVMLALTGCAKSPSGPAVVLDGRPRVASDEGVVTAVSVKAITIDGARTYKVSPTLQSFSSSTLKTLPLVQRQGQYVQAGLRGKTMVWIAGISGVVRVPEPTAYYFGVLSRIDGQHRAIFREGTVLQLAPSIKNPPTGQRVRADIDTKSHTVRALTFG